MKAQLNWRRLTALAAVITFTLVQSVSMSHATSNSTALNYGPSDVKLDAELRVFDSFLDDWLKVYQQHRVLSKKSSVGRAEFDAFKASSENVKNRCSDFQQAIGDVIKKLKEADRWNGLDAEAVAKSADDSRLAADLRDGGGLKHLLENASSQFCSQAEPEITSPIESLRPKLTSQLRGLSLDQTANDYNFRMVNASYEPAPVMFTKGARCIGATIRVAVSLVFTGKSGGAGGAHGRRECFCFDDCGTNATT